MIMFCADRDASWASPTCRHPASQTYTVLARDRSLARPCGGRGLRFQQTCETWWSRINEVDGARSRLTSIICSIDMQGGFSPINRNMWSLSFIGAMTGINLVLLSIFHYVCDIKMWWTGAPFSFMGRNSLLIYAGHEILRVSASACVLLALENHAYLVTYIGPRREVISVTGIRPELLPTDLLCAGISTLRSGACLPD